MTLEEALRLIDPATDIDEIDKIIYYHGFNGKKVAGEMLREASQMVSDYVRWMSWHDASNDLPPLHDESWENSGEHHQILTSDVLWVCCEIGVSMKGWYENGTWYLENGNRAEDERGGKVKLWAPLLKPPEVDAK